MFGLNYGKYWKEGSMEAGSLRPPSPQRGKSEARILDT